MGIRGKKTHRKGCKALELSVQGRGGSASLEGVKKRGDVTLGDTGGAGLRMDLITSGVSFPALTIPPVSGSRVCPDLLIWKSLPCFIVVLPKGKIPSPFLPLLLTSPSEWILSTWRREKVRTVASGWLKALGITQAILTARVLSTFTALAQDLRSLCQN